MFSREESKKLREVFWIEYGKKYPKKWILYNTKIKEIQLKFTFTNILAQVSLDVSSPDTLVQEYYVEKLKALEAVLLSDYLPEVIFDENYELPEGKTVARIYVQLEGVNIHNKNHWNVVQKFLAEKMSLLETFFEDFKDYLKD